MTTMGKLKIAKLDEFIERELDDLAIDQCFPAKRGRCNDLVRSWNLPWALERGLLHSPLPDLLLLSVQDTIFPVATRHSGR